MSDLSDWAAATYATLRNVSASLLDCQRLAAVNTDKPALDATLAAVKTLVDAVEAAPEEAP